MANLSEGDRFITWREYMQENRSAIDITKQELRDAIDATDQWIDANAISYNLALPISARTNLSNRQKTMLLVFVMSRRLGVL